MYACIYPQDPQGNVQRSKRFSRWNRASKSLQSRLSPQEKTQGGRPEVKTAAALERDDMQLERVWCCIAQVLRSGRVVALLVRFSLLRAGGACPF
jgi:hypothetical protein